MNQPGPPESREEAERLAEDLAEDYFDRLRHGETPDPAALLAAHPEIADLLERQLAFGELIRQAAEKQKSGADRETPHGARALLDTDSAMPGPAAMPCLERISRYVLREVLGQGASGTVYRAYDPKFDREVALKVLRSDRQSGPNFAERFEREARIAAQLRHPHIVPVHETGEHAGRRYIDMELVRGETLETRLNRAPVKPREAAELVRKLAVALDYAHGLGIVHRDVKPSNIVIDERGEPQLTDFGLARRAGAETTLTETGQIIGTVAYMSPEQAEGGSRHADHRSDGYSLGVVLYRLLTGRVPFAIDESLTTQLYQIVHTEPPSPGTLNPQLARDLETICLKAIAKDPADRFPTAAAPGEELRRWLNDEPLDTRRPTWWERARRWARRNRLAARVTAAAAVLLLVVGGTLGALAWSQYKQRYEAGIREIVEAQTKAEVQYRDLLARARHRLRLPTQGRRFETQGILNAIAEPRKLMAPGGTRDRRDLEARSLYAASLGVPDLTFETAALKSNVFMAWPVALHPDGDMMAIGTPKGPLPWRRDQHLDVPKDLDETKPRPRLAYSPEGKYLVLMPPEGGLQLWDGGVTRVLREWKHGNTALAVGFAPDGKTLCACCADGLVQSLSLPELQRGEHWQVVDKPKQLTVAAFNKEATRLAVGDKAGLVLLHGLKDKSLRELKLPWTRMEVEALAWSPDSQLVAVGTKEGNVQLWPRLCFKNGSFVHYY